MRTVLTYLAKAERKSVVVVSYKNVARALPLEITSSSPGRS